MLLGIADKLKLQCEPLETTHQINEVEEKQERFCATHVGIEG